MQVYGLHGDGGSTTNIYDNDLSGNMAGTLQNLATGTLVLRDN